jgi:diaminohydroxyphosphoribosylaminopyrimidine deaminase/5-amino-6-(5-phosphoribosylamino)uracil reductase
VVIATGDPAPQVAGGGIRELNEAGLDVAVGILSEQAAKLIAPFATLFTQGRPYVHAKWAMTLDGKIASRTGHSQWISGAASRRVVHELRGRMDAILVGAGTARMDDPLLTARPPGPRTATRIVVDRLAAVPLSSRLVQTIEEAPVLIAATDDADPNHVAELQSAGVEVLTLPAANNTRVDMPLLLKELGVRRFTNVLVEGGGELLGSLFDAGLIDELHVFLAPKLVGGQASATPIKGQGLARIPELSQLADLKIQTLADDVYINGRIKRA